MSENIRKTDVWVVQDEVWETQSSATRQQHDDDSTWIPNEQQLIILSTIITSNELPVSQ